MRDHTGGDSNDLRSLIEYWWGADLAGTDAVVDAISQWMKDNP